MTKLVDMKNTAEDYQEGKSMLGCSESDQPVYPWNMRLSLTDRDLKKLGMEPPKSGQKLMLQAEVEVTSVSTNEMKDMKAGTVEQKTCCDLTIMSLGLSDEAQPASAADRLYGKANG